MHRIFREHLPRAQGDSRFVVACFVDVRDFSSFFAESVEGAYFLRQLYRRLLDDFFPDASYFKPTGDGLMIISDIDDANIAETTRGTLTTSLRLVQEFPRLFERDPMINFPTPERLGIGIARGAASRLFVEGQTLDYSGRTLNLAARLMDLARPE